MKNKKKKKKKQQVCGGLRHAFPPNSELSFFSKSLHF